MCVVKRTNSYTERLVTKTRARVRVHNRNVEHASTCIFELIEFTNRLMTDTWDPYHSTNAIQDSIDDNSI